METENLHNELIALRDRVAAGEHMPAQGICGNVANLTEAEEDFMLDLMEKWPEHSGFRWYPVPEAVEGPQLAYKRTINVWTGEYGAARCRLLSFLIERTA